MTTMVVLLTSEIMKSGAWGQLEIEFLGANIL